ncbi:MAG: class I SAM-dependent methyltransferase [Casimicrobiaceae bacterium]
MSSPSAWVTRFAPLVALGARVLDLACGQGRHARYFAGLGHRVLAIDRDLDALATLRGVDGVETRHADLETDNWPLSEERFDAIVVTHYLHRPQFPHLLAALRPDGVLIYETFAEGNARFGKPSRPEFLLQPGELLRAFGAELTVVAFEQGQVARPAPAVIQRICALRPGGLAPPPLPIG